MRYSLCVSAVVNILHANMTLLKVKKLSCRAGKESEKLSQEDCYQLLIQAQEILRKEYIQKQNKAREEIEKR